MLGKERSSVPVWVSQTVMSRLPVVTSRLPSWLQFAAPMARCFRSSVRTGLPVAVSQIVAVVASPLVRTCLPSGLKCAWRTLKFCSVNVRASAPVPASQRLAFASPSAVRMSLPSGL